MSPQFELDSIQPPPGYVVHVLIYCLHLSSVSNNDGNYLQVVATEHNYLSLSQ